MKNETSLNQESQTIENVQLADIFNLFVAISTSRPVMLKPFEYNGKVYATDAHALIRTDKANIDFVLENKYPALQLEAIIPASNTSEILRIKNEAFEPIKTEDELEYVGKDVECQKCDGCGDVDWEFEHWTKRFECPQCNGDGLSEKKRIVKTGKKTFGRSIVQLKEAYFNIGLFYSLVRVQDFVGAEIELVHYSDPKKAVLFRVGVFEVLFMPINIFPEQVANYDGVLMID